MIAGITGSLLSPDALERVIPDALREHLDASGGVAARRRIHRWHQPLRAHLGPTITARGVFDRLGEPLFAQLGYRVLPGSASGQPFRALLESSGTLTACLVVTPWGEDLSTAWRDAVTHGIGCGLRWCLCLSGPALRVMDSHRTYSRRYLEFDVQAAVDNDRTFAVLWGLLRSGAMSGTPDDRRPLLERAIMLSEQHRASVRNSLQHGVEKALIHLMGAFSAARQSGGRRARIRHEPRDADRTTNFQESLVVVYRILFLLFAEARGLVPRWHPVFRDSYTIESLRGPVEMLPRPRGLWETMQAIARLAHRGCRAGSLRVPPFNGSLFSPAQAPFADTLPLDDGAVRQALLALTTRGASAGREQIAYADLGVEQLGGIYERLLDFAPAPAVERGIPRLIHAERRKATGSFYTPRSLTEYLVRRTLAPLVENASPEQILSLRVLDPAMGSGAFLVAACRYLARAYEVSLVREGVLSSADIDEREQAEFRRIIAQRCLFGVDINPMAVQLGRLSIWLATLSADKPLTFLDHRLRIGNSLIGASPTDVARQPPPGRAARVRPAALPLFSPEGLDGVLGTVIGIRQAIALEPADTLDHVRAKERALAMLTCEDAPLARWKAVSDLWCSGWFCDTDDRGRLRSAFSPLVEALLTGNPTLPAHLAEPMLRQARDIAGRERFFHWALEFPEIFHDEHGLPLAAPGFDAVLGNPPWEMLRGDQGDAVVRSSARLAASRLVEFARGSGIYTMQGQGHANLYQLFLERALSILRHGGRLGMVFPSGFATDYGCATLRRTMLDRATIDSIIGLENRDGLFPVHRSLKFLLITATSGSRTTSLRCHFGVRHPDELDRLPDIGTDPDAVSLTRTLIERLTGSQLAIPELRTQEDVEITAGIAFTVPALGSAEGWHVRFGRELNASDDRRHFTDAARGLPVLDGRHVTPFRVDVGASRLRISVRAALRLLDRARTWQRPRLAYRDVASAMNRLTLIAALIPPNVVTTHTLFCLKDELDIDAQLFLCGMFNSFVANYLVRQRVGTHVSASIIDCLPVPKPPQDSPSFRQISHLSKHLSEDPTDLAAAARLQAMAAHLYGVGRSHFQHIVDSFPLVSEAEREAAMNAFCAIV